MIYTLYLTNKDGFGDEGNAIYMSGYQIYALLLTISSIGIPNAIAKLISEKNSIKDYINRDRILKISLIIFGTVGFVSGIFLWKFSSFLANNILEIPKSTLSLKVLSPAIFFVSISAVLRGYSNGNDKIEITAKSQILEQIVKSFLTISLVEVISRKNSNTELLACFANLATTIATFISLIYIINRSFYIEKNVGRQPFQIEKTKNIMKKILNISIPITLCSIFGVMCKNIDSITVVKILKRIVGEKDAVIRYGILSSKIDLLIALPLSFNNSITTAIVPEISKLKAKNKVNEIANKIEFSILITFIICIPYCFGILFYSKEIIELLFPKAIRGAELLKISCFSLVFSALIQTINSSLQGLGKNKIPLYIAIISTFLKLFFNIVLIPNKYLYEKGAIISTLISNVIAFIIAFVYLNRNIKINMKKMYIFKIMLNSSIMIFLSKILKIFLEDIISQNRIITILVICFSVSVYCYLLLFVKKMQKFKKSKILENTEL